jgi:gluconolactonase
VPVANTDDEFAVGVGRKVLRVKWDGENESEVKILSEIAEVDQKAPFDTNRLNDGKADPKGRLYVYS